LVLGIEAYYWTEPGPDEPVRIQLVFYPDGSALLTEDTQARLLDAPEAARVLARYHRRCRGEPD
jgi:hypothetical protein